MKKLSLLFSIAFALLIMKTQAQTTNIKGLTVVVDFLDYTFPKSKDSVSLMMNQTGFNGWNCNGSVKDYFFNQSNGNVTITSEVVRVQLPYNWNRYNGDNLGYDGGQLLIKEIIDQVNIVRSSGFTNLTLRNGRLMHFNVIFKGQEGAGVAYGVDGPAILNNATSLLLGGVNLYGISGNAIPSISTICHEMGHSVMEWTDYYNNSGIDGSSNLGHYCVMGSGGTAYNPSPICAPFRYLKNWISNVTELPSTTQTYSVVANSRSAVYKYTNPANPHEFILIEALATGEYYPAIDGEGFTFDQGLAVWYVDQERLRNNPTTLPHDPTVKLIQADGLDEMHDVSKENGTYEQKRDLRGDMNDLFDNQFSTLSSATHPFFRWKDGSVIGISLTNISAAGPTMTFTVQGRQNTITSQLTASNGGKLVPSGLIGYSNGQATTINVVPQIGYVVDQVLVNGVNKGSISSYTFNGYEGNATISATFKVSSTVDALLSPWQKAEIGNTRKAGTAGYRNGVFGLESSSYDIWGNEDGLNFIYQTLAGDGEIVARVTSMNNPTEWSKAGLMMRETLSANSKHFMLVKTPSNNYAPQMRPETGGGSLHNPTGTKIEGYYNRYEWIKLVRSGNEFKSYCSLNGISNWILLSTYTIPMNNTIYVGMCAGAGTDAEATKVTFESAKVTQAQTQAPSLFAQYGIPRNAPLQTMQQTYRYVRTIGVGGPNLSNVISSTINWDLQNNGLWQFSLLTNDGIPTWYTNIPNYGFNSFNSTNPKIYIDNTIGFPGLGGFYFANVVNGSELVLVNQSGEFALLFTNKAPATRTTEEITALESTFTSYPNPFESETTISIPAYEGNVSVSVMNAEGMLIETKTVTNTFTLGNNYAAGLYYIKLASDTKSEILKVVKK